MKTGILRILLVVAVVAAMGMMVVGGCAKKTTPPAGDKTGTAKDKPAAEQGKTEVKPIELSYSIFFPPTHIQSVTAEDLGAGDQKTDQRQS